MVRSPCSRPPPACLGDCQWLSSVPIGLCVCVWVLVSTEGSVELHSDREK